MYLTPRTHFGALPRVQVEDDRPEREAVFRRQQFAVLVGGEDRAFVREVRQTEVGAEAVLGPHHHMGDGGRGRGDVQDGPGGDAAVGAEHAELRDAVQVSDDAGVGKSGELLVVPAVLLAVSGGAEHAELPALRPELGNRAVVRDRPATLHPLSRRKIGMCDSSRIALSPLAFHRLTHDSILTDPGQCT
ncbi:hypothetical protein SALBM311S_01889 [Streptomyces alboniger]